MENNNKKSPPSDEAAPHVDLVLWSSQQSTRTVGSSN